MFTQGGPAEPTDPMQTAPADLLREFEDVLTQAAGSLTPPDSPRSANGNNVLLPLPASHIHSLPLSPPANPGFIILQVRVRDRITMVRAILVMAPVA